MLKRLSLALLALILLLPLIPAAAPLAQAQGLPVSLLARTRLPQSNRLKFPQVATFDSSVYVAGNSNETDAYLWSKPDTATTFPGPQRPGAANGFADLATANVTVDPAGKLYYTWVDINEKRVYLRTRAPGGDFGPQYVILGSSPFLDNVELIAPAPNVLYLVWRHISGNESSLRYRMISNDGAAPGAIVTADPGQIQPHIDTAVGRNGQMAISYYKAGGEGGRLRAYAAIWNGSSFVREAVTEPNGNYADPTVTITPAGQYVLAYRGIPSEPNGTGGTFGTWFSIRQGEANWGAQQRLVKSTTEWVAIEADAASNLHLFWIANVGGTRRLFYSYKLASPSSLFTDPVDAGIAGTIFHNDVAITTRDQVYSHVAFEEFQGGTSLGAYALYGTRLVALGASGIVIEGGAATTNKAAVRVDFAGVSGEPTQVRYRWGAPPTPADPILPFSNPIGIAVPAPANPAGCTPLTLYTQLIAGSTVQAQPNADAITIDRSAQATATIASAATLDPAFTRTPAAQVTVRNSGDCSGLANATASGNLAANVTIPIDGQNSAVGSVTLSAGDGAKTVNVAVRDRLGNITNLPLAITLDSTAPALTNPGTVTVSAGAPVSGIAAVELTNVVVNEANLYGVQIVNVFTPTGGGAAVTGTPNLLALAQMSDATLANGRYRLRFSWSLASGLPATAPGPGSYQLRISFVDRAGNVSTAQTPGSVTLNAAPGFPRVYAPLVIK